MFISSLKFDKNNKKIKKKKIRMKEGEYYTRVLPLFHKSLKDSYKKKDFLESMKSCLENKDFSQIKNLVYLVNTALMSGNQFKKKWASLTRRFFYGISFRKGGLPYSSRRLLRRRTLKTLYLTDVTPFWFQQRALKFYPFMLKDKFDFTPFEDGEFKFVKQFYKSTTRTWIKN